MNIQISGLPENQKIKSINFNIVFDDSNIAPNTTITIEPESKKSTVKELKSESQKAVNYNDNLESINSIEKVIPSIDISKREPKIDPNMLDEVF